MLRSKSAASSVFSEISNDEKTQIHNPRDKAVNRTHVNLHSSSKNIPQSDRNSVKSLNRTRVRSKNNADRKRYYFLV